jgi:signal transduction histidine kinase
MMLPTRTRRLLSYATPFLTVALALLLTAELWTYLHSNLSLLFILAVMISAALGGIGPGMLAGLLSAFACLFFFMPPVYSFSIGSSDDALMLVVFVIVALLVSGISDASRRARGALEARVHERTSSLTEANQKLQAEVAERKRVELEILAYQARLQSLAVELSRTEERERRQIAATLHDAIGHTLAFVLMKLRGTPGAPSEEGVPDQIEEACGLIESCIRQARSLTLELSPPILYEIGLEAAIEWLAERLQREHGLTARIHDDGQSKPLPEEFRAVFFSAARELLFNVVKHAKAKNVVIRLARSGDAYEVVIEDDGIGFDSNIQASRNPGFGLFSIRERISHLGGQFEVDSAPGRGCRVTLRIPLAGGQSGVEDNT